MEFTKEIIFNPAWDKRNDDPNKNYGIHGVDFKFLLKGKDATIQFLVYTNWQLPYVQREFDNKKPDTNYPYLSHKPTPADIGYHSAYPLWESQNISTEHCEYLDDKPCYYDGSSLNAERVFKILLKEGSEGVWKYMESYYYSIIEQQIKKELSQV